MESNSKVVILGYNQSMISMVLDNLNSIGYCSDLVSINNELKIIASNENVWHPNIAIHLENISDPLQINEYIINNQYTPFLGVYKSKSKHSLQQKFQEILINSPNIVHANTDISLSTSIGFGNLINTGVVIAGHSSIGNFCSINRTSSIGHHTIIGDFCTINPGSTICGEIILENCVTIGARAIIVDGIKIGKNSIIGAGSLVINDIPPNSVVMGIPGKVVKTID
jgi:acetyltransferase EpsM